MVGAIALAAVLGLVIGSFINVVAHRVPLDRSIVTPPSACPACGTPIRPYDNIPVLSWVLLRGRCRTCGEPISARYPLVEAGTALLFVAALWVIGLNWVLPAYLWFAGVTMALILTDLDHHRLPNKIVYVGTAGGLLLLVAGALAEGDIGSVLRALVGGFIYFAVLLLIAIAARGGFGMGDVKLSFMLGVFLAYRSWPTLAAGIFLAFLVGGLVAVALLLLRRRGRRDAIAFGPALIVGAWLALAFGEPLVRWYLGV